MFTYYLPVSSFNLKYLIKLTAIFLNDVVVEMYLSHSLPFYGISYPVYLFSTQKVLRSCLFH